MEPEHNKERIPHWLNRYNKESHLINLSNYQLNIVGINLTNDEIKDIVSSNNIDH